MGIKIQNILITTIFSFLMINCGEDGLSQNEKPDQELKKNIFKDKIIDQKVYKVKREVKKKVGIKVEGGKIRKEEEEEKERENWTNRGYELIYSIQKLLQIRLFREEGIKKYVLMKDLDFKGVEVILSIDQDIKKNIELEGNNKKLLNIDMSIDGGEFRSKEREGKKKVLGLLGEEIIVRNLVIDGLRIKIEKSTGKDFLIGGITGFLEKEGVIENVKVINLSLDSESDIVGGIVGLNKGLIKDSYVEGQVIGKDYLGGLVGMNKGTIKNSGSNVIVKSKKITNKYRGGFVGENSSNGNILNSVSIGSVNIGSSIHPIGVGSFIGWARKGGLIANSHALKLKGIDFIGKKYYGVGNYKSLIKTKVKIKNSGDTKKSELEDKINNLKFIKKK